MISRKLYLPNTTMMMHKLTPRDCGSMQKTFTSSIQTGSYHREVDTGSHPLPRRYLQLIPICERKKLVFFNGVPLGILTTFQNRPCVHKIRQHEMTSKAICADFLYLIWFCLDFLFVCLIGHLLVG